MVAPPMIDSAASSSRMVAPPMIGALSVETSRSAASVDGSMAKESASRPVSESSTASVSVWSLRMSARKKNM